VSDLTLTIEQILATWLLHISVHENLRCALYETDGGRAEDIFHGTLIEQSKKFIVPWIET
jgi:hypothetical protein